MKLISSDVEKAVDGRLRGDGDIGFEGIETDTRNEDMANKLFIALRGENFDGHDYVQKALEIGCAGALVEERFQCGLPKGKFLVHVPDTLKALQSLSESWRLAMPAQIIALTGSNGKTTTKEFIKILMGARFEGMGTEGNLNNHIGVPLTLARLNPSHQFGVIEMGMNNIGEIEELVKVAHPDVVLVTNVGLAHLEKLKELNQVAQAKDEIYRFSGKNTTRIYNLDNKWTLKMFKKCTNRSKQITFSSFEPSANVFFKEELMTINEIRFKGKINNVPGSAHVKLFGRQNLENLMAASAAALACGMLPQDIWNALPQCGITNWGRNQILELESGATAVFDAYNANPESVFVLLKNVGLLRQRGHLFGIFGDMLELGSEAEKEHFKWGELIGQAGFEHIWYYGKYKSFFEAGAAASGFIERLVITDTYEESLANELRSMLKPDDMVLIKGSRGMKLERAVIALKPNHFE